MDKMIENQKGIAPLIIILIVIGALVIGGGAAYYFMLNQKSNRSESNSLNQERMLNDSISNSETNKTNSPQPQANKDSDDDGLTDNLEIAYFKTDPNNADTDGDGYNDGEEIKSRNNPLGKSCLDSDNGLDPKVKGTAAGTNGEFTDSCDSAGNLKEYSCETTGVSGGDTSAYYDELLFISHIGGSLNSNISITFPTGKVISKEIKCDGKCLDGSCPMNDVNVPADEMASWKIFRDDRHGFEFKYPEDWIVEPNSGGIDLHQKSLEEIGGIGCAIHPNYGTGYGGDDTVFVNGPTFFIYNNDYNSTLIQNDLIFRGFVDLPKLERSEEMDSYEKSVTFEKSRKMPDGSFGFTDDGLDDYCINKTKQILSTLIFFE